MTAEKAVMILLMEIIKAVSNGATFDYSCEPMNLTVTINGKIFRQADFLGPVEMAEAIKGEQS